MNINFGETDVRKLTPWLRSQTHDILSSFYLCLFILLLDMMIRCGSRFNNIGRVLFKTRVILKDVHCG